MQTPRNTREELSGMLLDSRERTFELINDLTDEQLIGPLLSIVNPPLWEIGHLAWFQEYWNLRRRRGTRDEFEPSVLLGTGDELYNSAEVEHDSRWEIPLLSYEETLAYIQQVLARTLEKVEEESDDPEVDYYARLATFHEDMHGEAFTYTRHTHGMPAPRLSVYDPSVLNGQPGGPLEGDAQIPGGEFRLGASPEDGMAFVFDNEKWAHPVEVASFGISRAPVTNEEFARFVDGGGYRNEELWSEEGRRWLRSSGAEQPVYWSRVGEGWHHRRFDRTEPLPPHQPMMHLCWYEAEAYCRWAGRRLPTEAEWELAAAVEPAADGTGITPRKRLYPWGDEPPESVPGRANLDGVLLGPVDVAAFPEGESAFGLRQMLGNVWEWCADDFGPYPGFERDPYKEYSEPWFGDQKVMRGGCWVTRGRMLRNTWRNFALPERRDLFSGFRTCAL